MREFAVPASFPIPADISMADVVFRYAEEFPSFVPFKVPSGGGAWSDVTAVQFAADVAGVAKGLMASGVEFGDRVAILAATRYEWVVLDFAIWTAGACTVAIYETSSSEQAKWVLEDSGTKLLVLEAPRHRATIDEIGDGLPDLKEILQIEPEADKPGAIAELTERGHTVSDEDLHARRGQVNAESAGTLIYTSGTTGRPKGVELTHANLYAEAKGAVDELRDVLTHGRSTLMFLPLAHVFARAISVGAFEAKVTVGHTSDWTTLVEQFAVFKPNFVLSVPRVFEKVYNSASQKAHDDGKGKIFDAAAATAIEWSESLDTGGPGLVLRLKHFVFSKLVYGKILAALGGECSEAVSGGGPLGPRLGHFFRGIGIPIYEGYGLTETTAGVSVNSPGHIRVGSVGRPFAGHAVKVAEDGEILVKGPVVFAGYWKNDAATAEAFDDGWFKTGDLGKVDEDGFISITGRKKEIIVTSAGKNVSPATLEDRLRANALISQAMVVGDARPFIGCLITLDREALPGWKERHGIAADAPLSELIKNPDLIAEIEQNVEDANKAVSKAEQIKKIRILEEDWTQETGELTPKMSLKRAVVLKQYASEVDAIYT